VRSGPLSGIRVLELGSFIAGPFAGQLLGDYGANVIKVEPPVGGDPMRQWGVTQEGESLWWPAIARNKRSVAVDLHHKRGRELVLRMARACDIIIENFRPGRLESWGLGYDNLSEVNSRLILVRVSGFGQTGPRAAEPGFGSIGEAVGGIRFTTGSPDRPPSRTGISIGDSLAAMFSVIGALAAIAEREQSGKGQEVDVAIYEAVAAVMESTLTDYEQAGVLRTRTGSVLPGVAPSNVYPTADASSIILAANADSIFARLCEAMGQPELATDKRYRSHVDRGANMVELDREVSAWTSKLSSDVVLDTLSRHAVPAGRIFSAADMLTDGHYAAREMVLRPGSNESEAAPMFGIVPKFSRTPGAVESLGPELGQHTREVLREFAGVDDEEWKALRDAGVVA
jgi:formyl-CoA transferase